MGILFKTYNGKHQLHLCKETWIVPDRNQLEQILSFFNKKELAKAKVTPIGNSAIELELNGLIVDCRNSSDLKLKFGQIVDLKEKYQKLTPEPKSEQKKN
jgi:hypothetical protein